LAKHAVIYEIDTRSFADSNGDGVGDLKGITQHLDYLQALGVDAILLDPLLPPADAAAKLASPIDPALGTVDDFDDLSLQASRHNIRILLGLSEPHAGLARFWLTRGIAGFYIAGGVQANPAGMQAIRKLLNTNMGQRVLITDAGGAAAAKPNPGDLLLDSAILKLPAGAPNAAPNETGQLRGAIEQSQSKGLAGNAILVSDATGRPRSVNRFGDGSNAAPENEGLAKVIGTVLLLNRSASMIYAGQELALTSPDGKGVMMPWGPPPVAATPPPPPKPAEPAYPGQYIPYVPPPPPVKPVPPDPASAAGQALNPGSVLGFYRQLIELHRGTSPLRDGEEIILNHDDQNALVWVRKSERPTYQNPPVFVVCNLSDKPLSLSLKADIARLHLRGTFLRTVLRSDDATGSMPVDPMTIPAYGVYVGELKY
jgi:alpha-glucosidase